MPSSAARAFICCTKAGSLLAHKLGHRHCCIARRGHADGLEHLVQRELPLAPADLTAAHVVGVLTDRHGGVHGQPPGVPPQPPK